MNSKYVHRPRLIALLVFAVAVFFAGNARAGSVKDARHAYQAQIHMAHSLVVVVESNHLVVRRSSGTLQALEIPEDFRFHMNGSAVSVHELKPQMVVAETVTVVSRPVTVKTVHIENATVWHTNGEYVIFSETNGQLKKYRIPAWARINVDGANLTVFDLRKGMKINATIIAEESINKLEN
jgi:archaellum component FlaF (FlaF/FlaG flagellin family)